MDVVQAGFGQLIGMWRPDLLGHYPVIAYRCAAGPGDRPFVEQHRRHSLSSW